MGINAGLMSSATEDWATPDDLFNRLDAEFGFDLDVCAAEWNHKTPRFFDKAVDGLSQEWSGVCWMNPPYGREIGKWMRKALESARGGATVVCLVPARTDTAWWHDYADKGEVRFLRGRVKFVSPNGPQQSAPFPSAVVVFRSGEVSE